MTARPPSSVADAVRPIAARLRLAERNRSYVTCRWQPEDSGSPTLHLEDVSAIPFLSGIAGVEEYQHRARVRAAGGDAYATVTGVEASYDAYCSRHLGLGKVTHIATQVIDSGSSLAVAEGCMSGAAFDRIAGLARSREQLVIHPYMAIEPVWNLARRVADRAKARVTVLGPPPPVLWLANDKALFDEVVVAVLGSGWTPETRRGSTVPAIAGNLRALASTHAAVGLKRTRCASAMGNQVFESADLRGKSSEAMERTVGAFLERTEWRPNETVLAVAWEAATSSPSTQWWIPPVGAGLPRLDGIYEQILEGKRKVFVGSRPSTLPEAVNRRLADAARRVAAALQELGYVGRCSFDHLVLGDPDGDFRIRFTECNGRWGGTSTPMHLVDRLVTQVRGRRPPYRAQDVTARHLIGSRFDRLLELVGDECFNPVRGTGRFIFYNVGPLEAFGKFDVIALGDRQHAAEEAMVETLPRLLGG
ncbi:MAG: hypothetical protein OXG72_06100 [Acidobacteria bacterium]|nr:hypothetical protein [Acidobacteriota bacterium]